MYARRLVNAAVLDLRQTCLTAAPSLAAEEVDGE